MTLKPLALAARMAATALSKVPSRLTDSSWRSRRPSMWTTQLNRGWGVNRSSLRSSSRALVHRYTNRPRSRSALGHPVDLGMQQGLAAGDGDHGRPGLLDGGHGLLDGEPLAQDVGRVLDLAAAVAGQVAGEQRLQLDDERELVAAGQLLAGQVGADLDALAQGDAHSIGPPGEGES